MLQREEAVSLCKKGRTLDPNNTVVMGVLAIALHSVEQDAEAERWTKQAMRQRPNYPPWYLGVLVRALAFQGKTDEAITVGQEYIRRVVERKNPMSMGAAQTHVALIHVLAGNTASAKRALERALEANPRQNVRSWVKAMSWRPARAEQVTTLLNDLNVIPLEPP